MKNTTTKTVDLAKTSNLNKFTSLSKKQLKTILGGDDPKTSRGTKTSLAD